MKRTSKHLQQGSPRQTRAAADHLLVDRHVCGDRYLGTKEELIAAGLAVDGMFPGDPGRRKRVVRHRGPPFIEIVRRAAPQFELLFDPGDNRRFFREQRRQAVEKALEVERENRDLVPQSRHDFRKRTIAALRLLLRIDREALREFGCGYMFAEEDLDEVEASIGEALDDLNDARVIYRDDVRQAALTKWRQSVIDLDPDVRTQVAAIVAAAGALDEVRS